MNQQLKVKTNLLFSGFQLWWWLSLARDFLFAFARDKAAFMGMERELKEKFPFRWWRTGSFPLTSKSKGSQGKSFCFSCWQFLNSSLVLLEIWAPCRALLPFFRPHCLLPAPHMPACEGWGQPPVRQFPPGLKGFAETQSERLSGQGSCRPLVGLGHQDGVCIALKHLEWRQLWR